jgi:hypothetical protein
MIQRKGKFDSGIKQCKRCGKDYSEKDNFMWSCRIHSSLWGGDMYWCCGKTHKEANGCRLNKHESKEDDSDDEFKGRGKDDNRANLKCLCCKEVGHSIDDCPRDPNLKKQANPCLEMDRISRIKDFRKLHADT